MLSKKNTKAGRDQEVLAAAAGCGGGSGQRRRSAATEAYQDYQGAGQLREKRPLSEKLAATTGEREPPHNCIAAGHRGEAPGSNDATGITVKQALGHACHTAIIRGDVHCPNGVSAGKCVLPRGGTVIYATARRNGTPGVAISYEPNPRWKRARLPRFMATTSLDVDLEYGCCT